MLNSKSLKPRKMRWMYEDEKKSIFGNVVYFFKRHLIWPISDNYRRTKERMKRSYSYARFGWLNFDFDMSYVYELLGFKLKRLYNSLGKGLSIQEPEDMKALKELIKIVDRLREGNYDELYLDQHDKKWGKIQTRTTPNYDDNGKITTYTWHSWRKKCSENAPNKVKKQEREERAVCYDRGEEDRKKDIDRMAEILKVHAPKFWD
jgi:hypothetical protein